ncbi:MAG: hypothetical protein AAFP86_00965 [Planctomycetota bacterium]
MADTLPIAIVAGLLAGGAGSAATSALLSKPAVEPAQAADAESLAELQAANERLMKRITAQEERIAFLEETPDLDPIEPVATGSRVAADRSDLSAYITREELKDELAKLATEKLAVVNPATRQAVASVVDELEEERRTEREQRRNEEREKRREDRLAQMQSDLGLDNTQLERMRTTMAEGEERMRAFWTDPDTRSMGREAAREEFRLIREDMNTSVQDILTPAQYETYQEKGYDSRGGFGRGGGGNDRGGNGGRGRRGGF